MVIFTKISQIFIRIIRAHGVDPNLCPKINRSRSLFASLSKQRGKAMRSSNLSLSILIIILVNKSLYLVNSSFVQTQLQYCSAIKQRTDANNARGIQRHFGVKKCPQLILRLSSSGHEMDNDTQMRFSGVGR